MSQIISLQQAIDMTTRYRNEKENILMPVYRNVNILCRSESYDKVAFDELLGNPECRGVRIYYGMDVDLKIHAIIVGTDDKDQDILPAIAVEARKFDPPPVIIDTGKRCPVDCPPASPLNP